ncbi:hypothetical protein YASMINEVIRUS_202, partial [Yasminevirus sp. GU-2018]
LTKISSQTIFVVQIYNITNIMNKSVNGSKKPTVKAFDPAYDGDDREMIFAWDNDKLMVRPNSMRCPSCNHSLPGVDADAPNAPNCKNMRCESCGYSVKLYGYGDLSYDGTVDDADYVDGDEYDTDREQPSNVYTGRFVKGTVERPYKMRRVQFTGKDNILGPAGNQEGNEVEGEDDEIVEGGAETVERVEKPSAETREHMDTSKSITGWGLSGYVVSMICMFLIAYCIASSRGETRHKDGRLNLSLLVCIFFFPQLYFGYVLVDWVTSPNHGC